ncbi:MAG: hypothetical protein R3C03_06865 [Pirellulaceae bacterium]
MKHEIRILAACLLFVALGLLTLWLFVPRVVEDQSLGEVFSRAIRDSGLRENAPLTEAGSRECARRLKTRLSNYVVQNRGFKKGDFYSLWENAISGDDVERVVILSYILSLTYFPEDGQEELLKACVQESIHFFEDNPDGFRIWVEFLFFKDSCDMGVIILSYLVPGVQLFMLME